MTERLFTFVSEFRGSTYVSQAFAADTREAVQAWAGDLRRERPFGRASTCIAKSVETDPTTYPLAQIRGASGVWCLTARCGGDLVLAHIIETTFRYMLHEIWVDVGSQSAGPVNLQSDKVLCIGWPDGHLAHSFHAYSDRDFWRQYYRWDGRGEWEPNPDLPEHYFTEAEVREQSEYLLVRKAIVGSRLPFARS